MITRSRLFFRVLRSLAIPLVLVAVPVLADAPADQYSPYVRADLDIVDTKTFLKWRRSVVLGLSFTDAANTATSCPDPAYRLPTMKELLTLVDEQPHDEYEDGGLVSRTIDRSAFPLTPAVEFWSSSDYAIDPSQAWVVDFRTGAATPRSKTDTHAVRCVQ
jgi:Protein of unknown function (DUF1566)